MEAAGEAIGTSHAVKHSVAAGRHGQEERGDGGGMEVGTAASM